jgi:hypothetical protein
MLGKKSHPCIPRSFDRIIETPDDSKLEYTDDCQLAPVDQPVARQNTVSGTKKKDNPFQVPLVPPRSRDFDNGATSLVDSSFLRSAAATSEELRLALPQENPSQAICSIHQAAKRKFRS